MPRTAREKTADDEKNGRSVASETTVMTIWPTIGATAPGRWVGRLSGLRLGWGFFTLGKLLALATIPLSLAVFCWQLLPASAAATC